MSVGKFSRRLTSQTPQTPAATQTVYHQARQLFSRSADPGQLIGREEERTRLKTFLSRCTSSAPGGCIYVSGPPGTGKSAMVKEVTDEAVSAEPAVRKAYINCMSIKSSRDLYATLLDQLSDEAGLSESDGQAALQKLFVTQRKKENDGIFVVILDEVDHILTLDLESMYRLFEWSLQKNSHLALVGIANALDLTDRFLPRLKSRHLKPELLPFLPYTAAQVKRIITTRLQSLVPKGSPESDKPDYVPFIHPAAIELCARKVSAQTGDLRRAFEVCRRALDLVESETRLKYENEAKEEMLQMTPSKRPALAEHTNGASAARQEDSKHRTVSSIVLKSLQTLTASTAPRVLISHLNKVTAAAFSHGTSQRLKTLNLQQKAALCTLVAVEKRNRADLASGSTPTSTTPCSHGRGRGAQKQKPTVTAPTVKTLFETYCRLCARDALLHPLSSSEFREVVGSLETLSLVAPFDGRNGSFAGTGVPGGQGSVTPGSGSGYGRGRKKSCFGPGAIGSVGDERRMASCVGDREMEQAVEGPGADILRAILSGEALD
ncbi:hypothetical protein P8C59_007395 [Phyllachora maydis]|nr:hypothetical protein P8C59_007395 [Phyllachora maydis]